MIRSVPGLNKTYNDAVLELKTANLERLEDLRNLLAAILHAQGRSCARVLKWREVGDLWVSTKIPRQKLIATYTRCRLDYEVVLFLDGFRKPMVSVLCGGHDTGQYDIAGFAEY